MQLHKTKWLSCIILLWFKPLSSQTLVDFALQDITNTIMYDMYSAPAAARVYAYVCLAGYEATAATEKEFASLRPNLQQAPKIKSPAKNKRIDAERAAAYAMYYTAFHFVYSEDMLMNALVQRMGEPDSQNSTYQFGVSVANAIIKWSATDGYAQTLNMDRYIPLGTTGKWEATPPDFAPGLEPYFGSVRRFVKTDRSVDSLPPLPKFNQENDSIWFLYAKNVYEKGKTISPEQQSIVFFWDDNPFEIVQKGHLQYAIKKVSPAGHWLDIARTALDSAHSAAPLRSRTYALVALAMADAVYAAWDAKYTYAVLRPETYINAHIDADWRPLIPSPPFPEYPSGHSCVSAAAATILTHIFGPDFDFTDASETQFDLPARSFTSFMEAAQEAGISRFYGGIHFLPSVDAGAELGKRIAEEHLKLLN